MEATSNTAAARLLFNVERARMLRLNLERPWNSGGTNSRRHCSGTVYQNKRTLLVRRIQRHQPRIFPRVYSQYAGLAFHELSLSLTVMVLGSRNTRSRSIVVDGVTRCDGECRWQKVVIDCAARGLSGLAERNGRGVIMAGCAWREYFVPPQTTSVVDDCPRLA